MKLESECGRKSNAKPLGSPALRSLLAVALLLGGATRGAELGQMAVERNQLKFEAFERSEGIYDRVVQKLQQKEEAQKKFVQEQVNQQLLMQEQQNLSQQREILNSSPYPSTLEGDL